MLANGLASMKKVLAGQIVGTTNIADMNDVLTFLGAEKWVCVPSLIGQCSSDMIL
jgi:hypothetical protein